MFTLSLIPQQRDGDSPVEAWVCLQIDLLQASRARHGVFLGPATPREEPAMRCVPCIDLDQVYDILEPLQSVYDGGPVCPGTDVVDVQHVSALFDREALGWYGMSELRRHMVPLPVGINSVARN